MTDYTKEIVLSDDILKRTSDSYRRIRNTIRFLLGNLSDFNNEDAVGKEKLTELDKWMIYRTKSLQDEIKQDYENFQFHQAFQKIHNFCANDLGGFYLDILKDRLYTAKTSYWHSPRSLSRYTPIWPCFDHSIDSFFAPLRFPSNISY